MKKLNKFVSMLLVVVMIFAMSINAFASVNTNISLNDTVTVKFTYNYSENIDGVYSWSDKGTYSGDLFTTNSTVQVNLSTLNGQSLAACKTTYSEPTNHAMCNTISVLDVVVAAALSTNHTVQGGWDSNPKTGLPGGYIHNIDNRELMFDGGDNGDGTWWLSGEGFVIGTDTTTNAANANPTFSNSYLSNVAITSLPSGTVIYVDLGTYFYSAEDIS